MSLDDLLSSPDVGPAEASMRVCLAGKLLSKMIACTDALDEIDRAVNRDPKVSAAFDAFADAKMIAEKSKDGEDSAPAKMGRSVARLREKYEALHKETRAEWPGYAERRAELEDLSARMKAAEGDLVVRAGDEGDWLRFVADNPARRVAAPVKDAEGNESTRDQYDLEDLSVTGGRCNADALRLSLHKYVATFNGEHVPPEKAPALVAALSGGDRRQLCTLVVGLHEGTSDLPKAVSDLLASPASSVS